MTPDEAPVPFDRRIRLGLRMYRAIISIFVLAIGLLLTLLAIAFFSPLGNYSPFTQIDSVTAPPNSANFNLVFVIVGPIIVIVGAYLVGVYFYARRGFEHLMLTKSKAEFLRNIPEIEDLLWDLTPLDERRYEEKRADLHLRR